MRRRNRKKKVNAFILPVPLAGIVVVVASLGVGYAMLTSRCQTLGNELSQLERRRDELLKQYQQEVTKWTRMKAPANLERVLRDRGINMTWPSNRQIVRLRATDLPNDPTGLYDAPQVARLDRALE